MLAAWLGVLPHDPGSPFALLSGQMQVSGDFGSGAEGGHQPSGKVGVSWCPWVLCLVAGPQDFRDEED